MLKNAALIRIHRNELALWVRRYQTGPHKCFVDLGFQCYVSHPFSIKSCLVRFEFSAHHIEPESSFGELLLIIREPGASYIKTAFTLEAMQSLLDPELQKKNNIALR
jgi:hypothetical protein